MRMSREDRTAQVLKVVRGKYSEAKSQSDFTAGALAAASGISIVWFYLLAGKEFRRLRSSLPGPIAPEETVLRKFRLRVKCLEGEIKELKARYKASLTEKFAEAIRHIELLDKENRQLRERVTQLEKRLNEASITLPLPPVSGGDR